MRKHAICNINTINIEEILMQINNKESNQYYIKEANTIDEQKQIVENIENSIQSMSQLYPTKYTIKKLEATKERLKLEKAKIEKFKNQNNKVNKYIYSATA